MVGAAAYNLTFQVGFATTQLCEAIAIALQSLIARELGLLKLKSGAVTKGGGEDDAAARQTRGNLYVWWLLGRLC